SARNERIALGLRHAFICWGGTVLREPNRTRVPRLLAFVMDSAGVGALPDAASFGDAPRVNTIGNVAERVGGLRMPNFERFGLGRTTTIRGVSAVEHPAASVGRL